MLMKSCNDYLDKYEGKRNITIEYVLIDGVNDSPELAKDCLAAIRYTCKINLIPFNPFPGTRYQRLQESD